jgi:hypothetical protein
MGRGISSTDHYFISHRSKICDRPDQPAKYLTLGSDGAFFIVAESNRIRKFMLCMSFAEPW